MERPLSIAYASFLSLHLVAQGIIEVKPLDLGAYTEDYAPVLLDSGIVFCSIRETSATIAFKDADTGKPLSDLYWMPLDHGAMGSPTLFSANLTTPVNEGPASFFDNGKAICFTRNLALPKKLANLRSDGALGLYFATLDNGTWTAPIPFEHNHTKYSTMHPAMSMDGQTMIFASDRPGGLGGVDLYRSDRLETGWSEPQNLGPLINGPGNEAFPSFGPDGTLYFASDRPGGSGKLDIYRTTPTGGSWQRPEAMPEPINSPGSDMHITFRPDGHSGYFSSDRSGVDRIQAFTYTVPKFRDCVPQRPNNYCYSFKAKPHAATSSLPLDHVWDLGDGNRVTDHKAEHCYTAPGNYLVRSLLVDRKTGTIFHTLNAHDLVVEDVAQAWINAPDTIRTGRKLALDANKSHLPDMAAAEYHWSLGDGTTLTGNKVLHAFKAAGTYTVKLDILSTANAEGVITNRCNTRELVVLDRFHDHEDQTVVVEYQDPFGRSHSFEFQELPFDQLGMTGDAMGDVAFAVELFATKERMSLDDPKFSEIKKSYRVVERFDPARGMYTYSVGEAKNMDELYEVFKKVKELQFLDAEVHVLHVDKLMDLSKIDFASVQELHHTRLRTNAIHFAYKSADLQDDSGQTLEQVLSLMRQYPELQLVIEAHTDNVGGGSYNLELSQQRAQRVEAFLISNGIAADRLVPIGHGKNQPIASNKTEEGRSMNRRVEFRLTVKDEHQAFQKTR